MNALKQLQERGMEGVLAAAKLMGSEALQALLRDLGDLDWPTLDRQRAALSDQAEFAAGQISPPPLKAASTSGDPNNFEANQIGWEALRAGRVAIATVAGGQASRLGFHGPKGAFPLGSVTGASLFQIMAGQIARLRTLSAAALPWIIQTGPGNHTETVAFFAARNFFGLGSSTVHFACQGTLPALSPEGNFLLESPGKLFRNPDGHGGFYRAIRNAGLGSILRESCIDLVYYCQVDNPLVRMADPIFLGHHLLVEAKMSVKVVAKTDPTEKVGLIVERPNGRLSCIEYSDLPNKLAHEVEADGQLRFRAGNIATHCFDLRFLEEMAEAALPLHLARKEIFALRGSNPGPVPQSGIKFETFVFDALPLADHSMVQLSVRADEFAPVKNRTGPDSIETSRLANGQRSRAWAEAAGLALPPTGAIEIQPGISYDKDDLRERAAELDLRAAGRLVVVR
jgi:UDP-N-acetylglucosamine/UDP-N-acetylgalactosamine diphosphorylase